MCAPHPVEHQAQSKDRNSYSHGAPNAFGGEKQYTRWLSKMYEILSMWGSAPLARQGFSVLGCCWNFPSSLRKWLSRGRAVPMEQQRPQGHEVGMPGIFWNSQEARGARAEWRGRAGRRGQKCSVIALQEGRTDLSNRSWKERKKTQCSLRSESFSMSCCKWVLFQVTLVKARGS